MKMPPEQPGRVDDEDRPFLTSVGRRQSVEPLAGGKEEHAAI